MFKGKTIIALIFLLISFEGLAQQDQIQFVTKSRQWAASCVPKFTKLHRERGN